MIFSILVEKRKKKKRVAFVHGPNNTSPFPPLGVVWCVGGSSSSIIPAQFLYRTPPCDVKEKLVREKEEEKKGRRSWYLIDGIEY